MADVQQRVACKGIIVRDNKILLLRESSIHDTNTGVGQYSFPGGRVEPGESFQKGFIREIKEETGLDAIIGEPFFVGEWFPVIKGVPNHIVGIFFLCTDPGGKIILSEEHDAYKWVDMSNVSSIDLMKPDDEVVEKYFNRFSA